MGIADEELLDWQGQLHITNVVSLNEFVDAGNEPGYAATEKNAFQEPEEVIEEGELKKVLAETLQLLTEKERNVILLYYYEDMTLKEISKVFDVSESRVSQLHTKALNKMKKHMGPYMNVFTDL